MSSESRPIGNETGRKNTGQYRLLDWTPYIADQCPGYLQFDYKSASYWPDLLETCLRRRNAELERWRIAGGRVGLSELDFKD
jgi:hypothetical protein